MSTHEADPPVGGHLPPVAEQTGVILETGASDWQVFQRQIDGLGCILLSGRWHTREEHSEAVVYVRLVHEDVYEPVRNRLDWQPATMRGQGRWSHTLSEVPAGGLYRLETCLRLDAQPLEWATRGDMVHHLGVGDLWLIAGQSNASGYGKSPADDGPQLGVHMVHPDGSWKLATHPLSDSTRSRFPANRERANGSHSPWLAFAKRLQQRLFVPIGLIPAALGGSALAAWNRQESGHLFENMLAYLNAAEGGVTAQPGSRRIRGVVWYQGESDTGEPTRHTYMERFAAFMADLRATLGDATLPVLTCQLNRYVGGGANDPCHAGWEMIRELQRRAAHEIPGLCVVSTLDAGLSDGIHNDSAGNLVIGQRVADTALGTVHGFDVAWQHPELVEAVKEGPTALLLRFAPVQRRLIYENALPERLPFAVRDAAGEVPVVGWRVLEPAGLRLELGRALEDAAVVVAGPTACPPLPVPMDLSGFRPMLGGTVAVSGSGSSG